jgi:hypothetical protein
MSGHVIKGFITLLLTCIRAEATPQTFFFLWHEDRKEWCGYSSVAAYNADVKTLHPFSQGEIRSSNGRVVTVTFVQTGASGDWNVKDDLSLNERGDVEGIKREIRSVTAFVREEETFTVQHGDVKRTMISSYDLETGKPAGRLEDVYPAVVGAVRDLPFWQFFLMNGRDIGRKGKICTTGQYDLQ